MVQKLSELLNQKVSIMIDGGAKGVTKIKGTITDTNDDDGLITLSVEGGMMGGKKKEMLFNIYSILGIEIEQ